MGLVILLALLIVPLIEIAVFIWIGGAIGLLATILIVILTAVLGALMLRQQGLATLMRARQQLAHERMPVQELFDGACLLVAGALLLTPGFVTDTIGFALMIPPLRAVLGRALWRAAQNARFVHVDRHGAGPSHRPRDPDVLEGDFTEVEPDDRPDPPRRAR